MHDILELHCAACGFSLRGVPDAPTDRVRTCGMCGNHLSVRRNMGIPRRLPGGLGLLMGAFVASADASPLLAREHHPVPGFARPH